MLRSVYEYMRETYGVTVEEFERSLGLPRYSVYPECRGIGIREVGRFMYEPPADQLHRLAVANAKAGYRDSVGYTIGGRGEDLRKYLKPRPRERPYIRPKNT